MITRPLDLASRLRPEPRNFDWLFYMNALALVLFFALFGSPFVLAPGLSVHLPVVAGGNENAKPVTHFISVLSNGQILTADGVLKLEKLEAWLTGQARTVKSPILLVRGDAAVQMGFGGLISGAASRAGFVEVTWAVVDSADQVRSGGR